MLRRHNEELELGRLKLADMAHKDRLTGLKNRRQFDALFSKYFQAADCGVENFTLLLIDLDDFKPINDEYGHAVGDLLLKDVGRRLLDACRGVRSDVFRLGGDEFAVLSKNDKGMKMPNFAKSLKSELAKEYMINDIELNVSASVGVCMYAGQDSTNDIFVSADRNLYVDKAQKVSRTIDNKTKPAVSVA